MLNTFLPPDLYPAAPEIFLLFMACAILLVDLFLGKTHRAITAGLTMVTLLGCLVITYTTMTGEMVLTFSNMFVDDMLADSLKLLVYITMMVVLVYSRGFLRDRGLDKGEYYVLVLFATLGMMVMISAASLVTIYLGLELLSLSLYALVALERDTVKGTEAAMKYFVLGALASGLLLYGMSMVYGATGTLDLVSISNNIAQGAANRTILVLGLVFLVSGIAFKLGAVPFHMWVPDVYQGASTPITLLVGSAPKLAAFAMAMRILVYGLAGFAGQWQIMLILLAVGSIALGNLAAIAQTNLKRMLAYSTISHMGFMLLALSGGIVAGDPRYAVNAYSTAMYYTVAYVMMSLAGFGTLLLLSRAGFDAERLDDLKGLNKRSPWFALVMLMTMFSMAGIPFFVGFFAKFNVLMVILNAGYVGVAVTAVMFSLVGAFYYLRVVKLMYFDAPLDNTPIQADFDMRVVLSANGVAIALFGIFPQSIMAYCAVALHYSL
jgi:NADH-quinone oxidoreductase subunit N